MKASADPKSVSRLAYLDNIRIFLTTLVIAHHTSIAFGGGGELISVPTCMLYFFRQRITQSGRLER